MMKSTKLGQQALSTPPLPGISDNALWLQSRLVQLPPRSLKQAFLTALLKLLHFSPVFPLDSLEQQSIEDKQCAADDQIRALDDPSNHGRDAPVPVLLRVDNNKGRDQAGQGVGRTRQVDSIELPDVIRAPTEGQPQQPCGTYAAGDGGDDEQGHVLDVAQHGAGGRGLVGQVWVVGQVADAGEGPREDDEPG